MLISHFSKWILPVGLVVSELGVRYYHFAPWRRNREKGDNIMVILGKRDGSLGTWALSDIFYVYDSVYIKSWQLNGNKLLVNILIRLHTSYQNIKLTSPHTPNYLFFSHTALSIKITSTNTYDIEFIFYKSETPHWFSLDYIYK